LEKITIQSQLCDGCGDCEHTCEGLYGSSRISIREIDSSYYPIICQRCENAPCTIICPTGAMETEGVIPTKCIGCGLCVMVCPFGAVHIHDKVSTKCDQCRDREEGPGCIKACSKRAISLLDPDLLKAQKQDEYLKRLISTHQKAKKKGILSVITSSNRAIKRLGEEKAE